MLSHFAMPIAALIAITFYMALAHIQRGERLRRARDIVSRGEFCQGRVIGIQRPFLLDAVTRLYFEYLPPGSIEPLRGCHLCEPNGEATTSLPAPGAIVTIRYLPDHPDQAIIGKLVSRFDPH